MTILTLLKHFLKSYKDTEENEETNAFSDSLLREQLQKQLKENKVYKIQVREKEEAFQLEKQRNKTLEHKNNEMKQELKQSEECSTRLTREIQKLKLEVEKQKQKNKKEVEKTKKYDKIAKELINIAGYEFDD